MSEPKVTTVKSGKEYRAKFDNGESFYLSTDSENEVVWIYNSSANLGGFNISRFDGKLSPASIRKFFEETK